jgi:uncharacterized damage-inducible protein DinB
VSAITGTDLFVDAFGRVREGVHGVLDGLSSEQLVFRPDHEANSIGWLVWHLTRVQDDHIADVAGTEQVWTSRGWCDRFALPFDSADTGYGHRAEDVAAVKVPADVLADYHDAVYEQTRRYVVSLNEPDFERVVDPRWDPPVTLGVRLLSVINDDLEHVGQAAYVRGLVERL